MNAEDIVYVPPRDDPRHQAVISHSVASDARTPLSEPARRARLDSQRARKELLDSVEDPILRARLAQKFADADTCMVSKQIEGLADAISSHLRGVTVDQLMMADSIAMYRAAQAALDVLLGEAR